MVGMRASPRALSSGPAGPLRLLWLVVAVAVAFGAASLSAHCNTCGGTLEWDCMQPAYCLKLSCVAASPASLSQAETCMCLHPTPYT